MFLVKIPSSQGAMHKVGSDTAPDAIIEAMDEIFSNESGFKHEFVIDEVLPVESDIEATNERIFKKADEILDNKAIFLGGDHSISYPIFKAFAKHYKNPGMIIFDAHPDCVNCFHPPSHEDWLRTLIDDGLLKPENVVLVTVRNMDEIERIFLTENRIRMFTAKHMMGNIESSCDAIMEAAQKFGALYISIDIDAVDPAFAPGTGYIEPAGLTSREMVYMIQRMKMMKNFRAADIVEVNPGKDINSMTAKLAAKLAAEMW